MLTALTGLNAARFRMDVVAQNVANANTPGFQSLRVTQSSRGDLGGTQAQVMRTDEPVDLNREMVEMVQARHQYTAGAKVIRTQADLEGSLLDILA